MRHIEFIVNPISGKGKCNITHPLLENYFPKELFTIEICYTEYKNHASELAFEAIKKGVDCIVACGGDGTINEVASTIVNKEIALGIVPLGSRNSLAASLGIPINLDGAIKLLRKQCVTRIDVGKINDYYFFSNTGIGVDAAIVKRYMEIRGNGVLTYLKAAFFSGFNFKPHDTIITINGEELNSRPFLLFVSNSNQMGYSMALTPQASPTDGFLNLVVVPELDLYSRIQLVYRVLIRSFSKFKNMEHRLVKQLQIWQRESIFTDVQIDGDYYNFQTNKIIVKVYPKALQVIAPAIP